MLEKVDASTLAVPKVAGSKMLDNAVGLVRVDCRLVTAVLAAVEEPGSLMLYGIVIWVFTLTLARVTDVIEAVASGFTLA